MMMRAYWFCLRWSWLISTVTFVLVLGLSIALHGYSARRIVVYGILLLVGVPQSMILFAGSNRRAKEFTPSEGEHIVFSDERASGYSNHSRMASFLMAKKSLIVAVTSDTIFLRPRSAGRGDMHKEFHRIRVADVTSAQKAGDKLRLIWGGETPGDFTLILAQPDEFFASIHRTSLGTALLS